MVCKFKRKKYTSIIKMTEKIMEMDPNNVKSLYFRGKAFLEMKDFDPSIDCFYRICQLDPTHSDGKSELIKAKKAKKDFEESERKKFAKLF